MTTWYLVMMPSGDYYGRIEAVKRPILERVFGGPWYDVPRRPEHGKAAGDGTIERFYRFEDGDFEVLSEREAREWGYWPAGGPEVKEYEPINAQPAP